MSTIDGDIEAVRGIVRWAYDQRIWPVWFIASCVLLGWRLARATGWAR